MGRFTVMAERTTTPEESPSRRAVREMTKAGLTPRQVANALGISTQRVHQHLKAIQLNGKKAS